MQISRVNKPVLVFSFALIFGVIIAFSLGYVYSLYYSKLLAGEGIRDTLSYQGKIVNADGVPPPDGNYSMQFKIYDALSGGNLLWTEIWDNQVHTGQSTNSKVAVSQGVFTVELNSLCLNWVGDCSANGGVTFQQDSFYLQVELDYDNNATFEEIFTPRKRFTATPYSMNADKLDGRDSLDFVLKSGGTMTGELIVPKVTDSSLIAYYQFNGTANNSSSYTDLDGTLQDGANIGSDSLLLDGDADYILVDDNDLLSFGNGTIDTTFTFSAWVNLIDPTNSSIISKGIYNNGDAEYNFGTDSDGKFFIHIFDESVADCYIGRMYSAQAVPTASWINVTATYSGSGLASGLKLYLNGELVDDADSSGTCSYVAMESLAADLFLGRYNTEYANGKLDDISIFNRTLTADEVRSLFSTSKQRYLDVEEITTLYLYLNAINPNTEVFDSGYLYFDPVFNRIMLSSSAFIPDFMPYKDNFGNDRDYTHFIDENKILAYDFSDPINGVIDLEGNANGTVGGDANFANNGFIGYGLVMDNNNDYISFSDPGISTAAGTFEMWARLNNIATSETDYLAYFRESGGTQLEIAKEGTSDLYTKIGDSTLIDTTFDIPDTNWHHYALTWTGGSYFVYVDGVLVYEGYYSTFTTPTTFLLGYGNTSDTSLNGAMDSVALYDEVITDGEIVNHAQSSFNTLYVNDQLRAGVVSSSLENLLALPANINEKNSNDPVYLQYTGNKQFSFSFSEGKGLNTYSYDNDYIYAALNGATWNKGGMFGHGMSFDGINDYLEANDDYNLNPNTDDFAIEFWINGAATGNNGKTVLSKRSGDTGYEIYFDASSNNLQFFIGDNESTPNTVTSTVSGHNFSDGKWHHFLVSFERGGYAAIYSDGDIFNIGAVDISSLTGSITNNANLLIGKNASGNYFNGKLDSIVMYNLSGQDQFNLYDAFAHSYTSTDFLFVDGKNTPAGIGTLSLLNQSQNGHGAVIGMRSSNNTSNYPLALWNDNADSDIYNLIYFGSTTLGGGGASVEYGNLKWDSGNSKFMLSQSLDVTGDLAVNSVSTDGNEKLVHDVIRHTVTSGEATANTFTESSWGKATQDKIVSLSALTLDLSADPDLVIANDWSVNLMDCNVVYDGTDITVTEQNGATWAENDIVTIYIVYEK